MKLFLEEIEEKANGRKGNEIDLELIQNIPLNNFECLYLFDFTKNKVLFHKGFDTVFGYNEKQIDMGFVFDKYHPEDAPLIQNIVKELVIQMMDITIPELSNILNISYRFKKKDGTYARVLSNTIVYQTDDSDRVLNILIKYTDISFTNDSDAVEWLVDPTYIDMDKIKPEIYAKGTKLFTSREMQVISRMFEGKSNVEIASILRISKQSVAIHRKNILFKSDCSDSIQLKLFCKRNAIKINAYNLNS